jgi:hypothetical protein
MYFLPLKLLRHVCGTDSGSTTAASANGKRLNQVPPRSPFKRGKLSPKNNAWVVEINVQMTAAGSLRIIIIRRTTSVLLTMSLPWLAVPIIGR